MKYYANRYYSNRYKKKKINLTKMSEKSIIQSIKNFKTEIEKLEKLKIEYLDYKIRKTKYEEEKTKSIEPLKQIYKQLIEEKDNYKKGIRYLFKEKELNEDIKLKVTEITNKIDYKLIELEQKYRVKKSPYLGHELDLDRIDYRIENDVTKRIIDFQKSIEIYNKELEKKQDKNQKNDNIIGLAAQATNKTRQRAKTIKNNIEEYENCPYCGETIIESHVDHIYPVSKGGLSTTKNMVRVCNSCNIKKRDLTLNQFIRKYELDREFIERNLDALNKSY